jgi:hypothetical protein
MSMFNQSILLLENLFYGEKRFDVLLAIANFISHLWSDRYQLSSKKKIESYIEKFYNLLKPGGTLMNDHRNFSKIKLCIDKCKNDPNMSPYDAYTKPLTEKDIRHQWEGFSPYSFKTYYCGEICYGPKSKITTKNDEEIVEMIAYYKNNKQVPKINKMYPLEVNFVKDLLFDAGFNDIIIYKDNEINDNGLPQHFTNLDRNKDYKEDYSSDFFIYIATKY